MIGLIACFHAIIYAKGRQIYSLSRAGYFPTGLSVTHTRFKTPHVAMISGALLALTVMLVLWFSLGAETGGVIIGGTLLNMAVFAAMFSYIMQSLAFIRLRQKLPDIPRPYRSPLGIVGPVLTIVIGTGDDLLPAHRSGLSPGCAGCGGLVRHRHPLLRTDRQTPA